MAACARLDLAPEGVLVAPEVARTQDHVGLAGLDEEHVVFTSSPRSLDAEADLPEAGVPSEVVVVARGSGAVVSRTTLHFRPIEGGTHDWIAQLSVPSLSALTRRGQLLSLADGRVRAELPFTWRDVVAFARDGRSFLWGRKEGARSWIASVHDTATGAARSTASGVAPMMCYAAPDLARVIFVGQPRAYPVRSWRTDRPKTERLSLPVKGDLVVSRDLARWILWDASRVLRTGSFEGGEATTLALPAWTASAGIRYALGERVLVVAAATAAGALSLLVYDLAEGRLVDEVLVDEALERAGPLFLDPTERWLAFTSSAGPCVWRLGSRTVHRAAPPAGPRVDGFGQPDVVSVVAMSGGPPWTITGARPGFFLAGDGGVAFYRLPENR